MNLEKNITLERIPDMPDEVADFLDEVVNQIELNPDPYLTYDNIKAALRRAPLEGAEAILYFSEVFKDHRLSTVLGGILVVAHWIDASTDDADEVEA